MRTLVSCLSCCRKKTRRGSQVQGFDEERHKEHCQTLEHMMTVNSGDREQVCLTHFNGFKQRRIRLQCIFSELIICITRLWHTWPTVNVRWGRGVGGYVSACFTTQNFGAKSSTSILAKIKRSHWNKHFPPWIRQNAAAWESEGTRRPAGYSPVSTAR